MDNSVFQFSSHRAKDRDKELIFAKIKHDGPISQKRMLAELRVRPTTLSISIRELLEDRLILQHRRSRSGKPGRPEIYFQQDLNRIVAIGIYADSWVFRGTLLDLNGRPIESNSIATGPQSSNKEIEQNISTLVESLLAGVPENTELVGIGIAVPGNVDSESRVWRQSDRFARVRHLNFDQLQNCFHVRVQVFRDLDAILRDRLSHRLALRRQSVVLFHWGIGLGFAYATRGMVIGSNYGRFGTIGYVPLMRNSRANGKMEKVEDYTLLRSLLPHLRDEFPSLTEDERVFYQVLHQKHILGNPAIRTAVRYVAHSLSTIAMLLYPDEVILLGPLAENKSIFEEVQRTFRETELKDRMERKIRLSVVRGGYSSAATGATYDLFRESLRTFLTARY